MKAIRIVVKVKDPMENTETYRSPRVFLFSPWKVSWTYYQGFINKSLLLFNAQYPKYDLELLETEVRTSVHEIYPLRDLFGRLVTLFKYAM